MKDHNSALGAEIACPRFDPCPLCFGCRNYDSGTVACDKCCDHDFKGNVCNTGKHTEHALNLMLRIKNHIHIRRKE